MGSKAKIAKDILPIILNDRKEGQYYVEPFCGGCNTLDKVTGNRIGNDLNKYLIAMWKGLQNNNFRECSINKNLYAWARYEFNNNYNLSFSDFDIGWIGWCASFNGRFFDGGYSGVTKDRNYIKEQIKNIEKQIPNLQDVEFFSCDYSSLVIPPESIIYCDIPYNETKQYSVSRIFNYSRFWDWCKTQKGNGHQIFISEYSAPTFATCIWEKTVTNSMNTKITYKPTEKLFTI